MNTDKIYAEQIANEYAPKDTSKVVALRKLDARAKLTATVFTYSFGIAASLIAGVGMCLSMKVIGSGTALTLEIKFEKSKTYLNKTFIPAQTHIIHSRTAYICRTYRYFCS